MSPKRAAKRAVPVHPTVVKKSPMKIGDIALGLSKNRKVTAQPVVNMEKPFDPAKPMPGVLPAGQELAMDEQIVTATGWANGAVNMAYAQGYEFLGYAYLAQLAQVPEYRRISEVLATEMTRKWIRLQAAGEGDKSERIAAIVTEMERLNVQEAFRELAEQDGFFGRSHLYLDFGSTDDPEELKTPIGNGRNEISRAKIKKGSLKRIKTVEAVWTYPAYYNSNNPLKPDWYKPSMWFVQGTELHGSRLLTFIGREVPDLLKPAYSFGGLSLSQMAKPYVDNWLRIRQSVSDLIWSFSVSGIKTNLQESLQADGDQLFRRVDLFNNLRDNRGTMLLDKDTEEYFNISTPLTTLDMLQAQAQEHMAAVSGIPIVKLLGIQPAGLNASSEGEIRSFYDFIHATQEKFFGPNLRRVIDFIQISLFGDVDTDITYAFEPLWSMSAKEEAEERKIDAETGQILIDSGAISQVEERKRIAADPDSPYQGLDPDEVPDLLDEEEDGLEPFGGRPDPIAGQGIAAE